MAMQQRRVHCILGFPQQLLSLLLLLHSLFVSHCVADGLTSERASPEADAQALLAFKAAADPLDRLTFSPTSDHCRWPGVSCSADGKVYRLLLESAGLTGTFPNGTLGRLDQLHFLSLQDNALVGPLPGDLSGLRSLKALFLDRNLFAGPFPASLLSLRGIRALDLSHNRLSGPIPAALATLDGLIALRLEGNRFVGSLPAFNQSSLKSFNVSGNFLSGAVPITAVLASFDPSAFADNPGLCGALARKECASSASFFPGGGRSPAASAAAPSPIATAAPRGATLLSSSASRSRVSHKSAVTAIGFLIGAIALVGIFTASFVIRKKRTKQQGEILALEKNTMDSATSVSEINVESYNEEIESMSNELEAAAALAMAISEERVKRLSMNGCLVFCAGEAPIYNLEHLMRASAEMLGRGSLGSTYKAVLDARMAVTVKRLDKKKLGSMAKEGFERQMDMVGRLRHPNLVPLRAYFRSNDERLLVYDFQPNGSLYSLIHGSRSTRAKPLHWTSCLKIADDVVQGLAHIHQSSCLIHGNIKSSNILLGSDFEACLTDSCLSFLLEPSDNQNDSGYRAPEARNSLQELTPSSDIYAFGVLLLELLTGKPPLQHPVLIPPDLPVWVRSVREDGACDERLMMIIDIAAACIHSSPECRPTTWQVLKMIQEVKETDTGDNDTDSTFIS
ncbi:probable inactive receptor kinase At5g67200 [Musa acuminata AAA Group]|uniref:probable inactive receptor kinase At5g67200 n=1 Tax=Musa acuminata AAA Group TaxID=214697 RepID=UPI0031DB0940